jgi:hypothetical protein
MFRKVLVMSYFISSEEGLKTPSLNRNELEGLEMFEVEGGWEIPEHCLSWQSASVQGFIENKYNLV